MENNYEKFCVNVVWKEFVAVYDISISANIGAID